MDVEEAVDVCEDNSCHCSIIRVVAWFLCATCCDLERDTNFILFHFI